VFAVWEPMLPTDFGNPGSGVLGRLSDSRVQQFWDPDHVLAKRLAADAREPQPTPSCCTRSGILWDLMAIYPRDLKWSDHVPAAAWFDGPVVNVVDGLERALGAR
jgi:hypothetical protein